MLSIMSEIFLFFKRKLDAKEGDGRYRHEVFHAPYSGTLVESAKISRMFVRVKEIQNWIWSLLSNKTVFIRIRTFFSFLMRFFQTLCTQSNDRLLSLYFF